MTFEDWLKNCLKSNGQVLSLRSIDHYNSGLNSVSKEMYSKNVISKLLQDMDLSELDKSIQLILTDSDFIKKDLIGKKMYSNALKKYRCYLSSETDYSKIYLQDEAAIRSNITLTSTEKEEIIKARVGQGKFKDLLNQKYDSKCIITGITTREILIASHIKPWSVSNNIDRLSVDNGLILSASYDKLFDRGLISFTDRGELMVSGFIDNPNLTLLQLQKGNLYNLKGNITKYRNLDYHRKFIFLGK